MSIQCPTCQQILSTAEGIPRFCSHCGAALANPSHSSPPQRPSSQTPNPQSPSSQASKPPSSKSEAGTKTGSVDQNLEPTLALTHALTGFRQAPVEFSTHRTGISEHSDVADSLPPDSRVGPFRIARKLGQGGMGTVYEAVHVETGQTVALKLLSRSVRTTAETIQRFQRESQIAASINHPRSTFVYQAGQHEGQFYITMELMTGGTLNEVIQSEGAIPVDRAVDCILDIISGLQAAHQVGIVHRDLKPSNCFLEDSGRVKIGDFGLAKSFLVDSSLTQTGTFMGTPQYAAPEQLRASDVGERADIYAVGGTLFYLLTGRGPFVGNAAQVIASIASDHPPRVDSIAKHVPRELSRVIAQTLEKDPARRPENLSALRQALLPYSTRGSSVADLGRRMAAFFIDIALISLLMMFISNVMGMMVPILSANLQHVFLANLLVSIFFAVGYFAIQEWRWGTTLGKWMLGMRVISTGNQSPGLLAAVIRAVLLPGISYAANGIPAFFLELSPDSITNFQDQVSLMAWMQVSQFFSWTPNLLCFATARKSNGFLGFHEIVSGTQVVRLAGELEYQRPKNIPVTAPVALSEPETRGEFRGVGEMGVGSISHSPILLGWDDALNRNVWIFDHLSKGAVDNWESRKSLARSTRLRVIAEQSNSRSDTDPLETATTAEIESSTPPSQNITLETESNSLAPDSDCESIAPDRADLLRQSQPGQRLHRSVVTEAIKGMPLVDYVRQTPRIDWRSFRPVLRDLVQELDKSQADGTLPKHLAAQSVWIDHAGLAKLLDEPLLPARKTHAPENPASENSAPVTPSPLESNEQLSPFELITSMLDQFINNQVVPAHVLTFRKELDVLRSKPDCLERITHRLGELADQPSAWRWDDRMGVLAITIGVEYSTAFSFAFLLGLLTANFIAWSPVLVTLVTFGVMSVAALALGGTLGGGPVFHICGVLVRKNKTLEPASPLQCGLRNWIAWFPLTAMAACLSGIIQQVIQYNLPAQNEFENLPGPLLVIMLLALIPLGILMFVGALYSIVRPSRGLADVIAGTRLIRK